MGRPRVNPHTAKTGCISCRVDPSVAAQIKASARENGRSISAEVEFRLAGGLPRDTAIAHLTLQAEEKWLLARLGEVREALASDGEALRLQGLRTIRLAQDAKRKGQAYAIKKAVRELDEA